ncbi:MAG: transporter substrate-binding domain-containing protein [Bermanella sp.]
MRSSLYSKLLLFIILFVRLAYCHGETPVLRFNVTPQGFPPYIISSPPAGIMYDVLSYIAHKQGYKIVAERIAENRVTVLLDHNKLDAHASAMEWVSSPEKYAFTDPVLKVRDVVFTRKNTPLNYQSVQDLLGHRVGVRTGYSYQSLTEYFNSGKIKRVDSSNELYLLQMLTRGRLDIAIITEHVALWLIKKNNIKTEFIIAKNAVDTTDYRLVFSKKWAGFIKKFNEELVLMKSNGHFKKILSQYR